MMAILLRQSTASQEVALGYFLDSADGNSEETTLTIANTDIKLHKTGATTLANKNSGGATHISNGIYYAVLDATDTDTLGPLVIFCHVAGALAVRVECLVVTSAAYDVMTAATGDAYARLGAPAGASVSADVAAVKAETASIQTDTNDIQTRLPAALVSGRIDASVGAMATDTITSTALAASAVTEIQSGLSTLDAAGIRTAVGLATANLDTQLDALPTAAENADAIWDEALSGHATAGTSGKALSDVLVDTAEIGAAGAGLTALATQASVNTIDDFLDTEVAAILAAVDTEVAAIKAVTDAIPDAGAMTSIATAASIAALNDISTAEVNAQVVDALATDTYAEPGSVPSATATLAAKIGWLYTLARNKVTQTSTTQTVRNDADSADIATATCADDGTTMTRSEFV